MKKRYVLVAFAALLFMADNCTPGFAGNNPATNIAGANHNWQAIKAPLGINAYYEIRPWGSGQALVLHLENMTIKSHTVEVSYSLSTPSVFFTIKTVLSAGQVMEGGSVKGNAPGLVISLTPEQVQALKKNKPEFKIEIK